jgi:hypothetical protein
MRCSGPRVDTGGGWGSNLRQEAVNAKSASLQTEGREAVEVSLPISMHAGQIFLLTKLLTASDLHFYDFDAGAPVERWHTGPSGSP